MEATQKEKTHPPEAQKAEYQDCLGCRIVGTVALSGVGLHALNASRAHKPGSPLERRIMGAVGVAFLIGGAVRAIM
ncbi:hypothetical protein FRC02_009055 [Tulasnella sp. 418]|nr:hypothetical protein FRC02_009055 [Tulasnella sp. 418]